DLPDQRSQTATKASPGRIFIHDASLSLRCRINGLRCPGTTLTSYHLRGKLQICLAARTPQIIEDRRLTVRRSFRDTHVPGYHGLVHSVPHECSDILNHLK